MLTEGITLKDSKVDDSVMSIKETTKLDWPGCRQALNDQTLTKNLSGISSQHYQEVSNNWILILIPAEKTQLKEDKEVLVAQFKKF